MLRKYLFWGLTLVLLAALVTLIVQGRRMEKQEAGRLVEVVQESRPTATRVLAPQDFEIVHSTMRLEEEPDGRGRSRTARHEIEIRNNGKVPYGEIQLSFDYLDRSGKVLATKIHTIAHTLSPGASLKFEGIKVDGIPAATADSRVSVLYADIGQAAKGKN